MNCAECMWGVWDYTGIGIRKCCVDCKAGLDDRCPTAADFEAAKYGGYLAYYGCAGRINDLNWLFDEEQED